MNATINGTSYNPKADLRKGARQLYAKRTTHETVYPTNADLFGMPGIGAEARIALSYVDRPKRSQPWQAPRYLLTLSAPPRKAAARAGVAQNDVVVLAGRRGTWKVVAAVNGTKADIRRRAGFDTRIVTALIENLTVVRRAGSPGCSY